MCLVPVSEFLKSCYAICAALRFLVNSACITCSSYHIPNSYSHFYSLKTQFQFQYCRRSDFVGSLIHCLLQSDFLPSMITTVSLLVQIRRRWFTIGKTSRRTASYPTQSWMKSETLTRSDVPVWFQIFVELSIREKSAEIRDKFWVYLNTDRLNNF